MQRYISLDVCNYIGETLCSLYDSSNDLDGQATNVIVHTERNGFKELRFELPSTCEQEKNYRLDYLISDYRIRLRSVKRNIVNDVITDNVEIDWFLISESKVTHKSFSTNYEIRASHISTLLNTKNLSLEFSDEEGNNTGTIGQIAATILEGTGWHLGYVATFMEEDKFSKGQQIEKSRSFTASARTGAFKMMSDLCQLFDAKPIYHGEGTYTEDGQTKTGRTVDIIPMNPFSEKLEEGTVPPDLDKEKILELYYDKNVSQITRTLNTENLVTVFSAYGSYGDLNGMASLQNAEHAVISLGNLEAGEYCFEFNGARYYFTTDIATENQVWSSLDYLSRSYIFNGVDLFKVYKEPKTSEYITLEITDADITYEKNRLTYIMDFSYYEKIGLLDDSMLLRLAQAQTELPQLHVIAQEMSTQLSNTKEELSKTASAGNGFLMLDVANSDVDNGYVRLTLDKSHYEDGVIFRSDYGEARRNYFTWNTATGIKDSGEAIAGRGAVVYIVHQDKTPTKWEKSYVKALGNGTNNYYRDSMNNIYQLHQEDHRAHKNYVEGDTTEDYFPVTGTAGILYIDDETRKLYTWINNEYTEIQASSYYYGMKEFPGPDTITLWTTEDTWKTGDKVYLFSADSIAGLFGPREDEVLSNRKAIEDSIKIATEIHPIYFVDSSDPIPSTNACEDGYGWYYRTTNLDENHMETDLLASKEEYLQYMRQHSNEYKQYVLDGDLYSALMLESEWSDYYDEFISDVKYTFGNLYFCWGKDGDLGWSRVYISDSDNNPETLDYMSGYNYYYSTKRMMLYKVRDGAYNPINNTVDEKKITNAFAAIIEGCIKQEMLTKGMYETYNYSDEYDTLLHGNYALKNEYGNYWLFTTDIDNGDASLIHYDPSTKLIWQDNDENHVIKAVEHSFRYLDFPKKNELYDISFQKGSYKDRTFSTTGDMYISDAITVHDNVEYEFSLPADSIIVCRNTYGTVTGEFTQSSFTTPNHTTQIKIVCNPTVQGGNPITTSHYLRVENYDKTLFSQNVQYKILSCTGAGERLGINYLMDKFIELSYDAYMDKVPALKEAQQNIENVRLRLSNLLGDMYREGYWQETNYVEGDEDKLYTDALDNLKEISHPQADYEITYLELYGSDDNLGDDIKVDYPDIDITYAVHLVDTDIDTNRWAYIDSIDKCYDQPWKTTIQVNTKLSMIGQQSFTDVLAKIAEVANETKAKQAVYERAKIIGSSGSVAATKLEGLLQANKIYLNGGTSNWYTDTKGNIIFESADGNSAMMLSGRGLMISNTKDEWGDWDWKVAMSGNGFNADVVSTGEFSAQHILAGSITSDKLSATVGQDLEISSNKALALYATADGERPAGSLKTTDGIIEIKAGELGDPNADPPVPPYPAEINILSGGMINLKAGADSGDVGGIMNIESTGQLNIKGGTLNLTSSGEINIDSGTKLDIRSGSYFTVDSPNFSILKNNQTNQYDVTVRGNITTTGGNIAGFTIGRTTSGNHTIDFMRTDNMISMGQDTEGVYVGTDGINIGGKLVFSKYANGAAKLKVDANDVILGQTGAPGEETDYTLSDQINDINDYADSVGELSTVKHYITDRDVESGIQSKPYKIGDYWTDTTADANNHQWMYKYICVSLDAEDPYDNWQRIGADISGAKLNINADAGTIDMVAANTINITSGAEINIAAQEQLALTTNGSIVIGKAGETFTIGATQNNNAWHPHIQHGGRTSYLETGNSIINPVYIGTDGISLGQTSTLDANDQPVYSVPFSVSNSGSLIANDATIRGNITALSGKLADWNVGQGLLYSGAGSSYVALASAGDYSIWAGNTTASSASFYVKNDGYIHSTYGDIAGWTINTSSFTGNKTGVAKTTNDSDIAFWAGHTTATSAAFQVNQAGALTATSADIKGIIRADALYVGNSNTNIFDANGKIDINQLNGTVITDNSFHSYFSSESTSAGLVTGTSLETALSLYTESTALPGVISSGVWDTLGQGSGITYTTNSIKANSTGEIDLAAAKRISLGTITNHTGASIIIDNETPANNRIYLDVDDKNYIRINKNGILLAGKKVTTREYVTINGTTTTYDYPAWGRDDIIIMNPNSNQAWRTSVSNIEARMVTNRHVHDWILIRPFYDAELKFTGGTGSADSHNNEQYSPKQTGSFGGAATWYQYVCQLKITSSTGQALTSHAVTCFLANKPFSFDPNNQNYKNQAQQQASLYKEWSGSISGNGTTNITFTFSKSGINLCAENEDLYFYIHGIGNNSLQVSGHTLTATCDATNGRVPCTVYYYP